MNLKISGMHFGEKDRMLLRYLHSVKVATYEQIARDIYPDYNLDSVGNRLRKLENNRLISSLSSRPFLHGKRIVSLTKLGFENFVTRGDEFVVELHSEAIMHDLALNDIRSRIVGAAKVREYYTENEIQAWDENHRKLNSDGLFALALSKRTFMVPLEYESSMKIANRYIPIVKKYYQMPDMPLVAYIADSQAIIDKVAATEKTLFGWDKPKFFYRLKHDFLADDTLWLKNYDNGVLSLGD
jgi:hypothetical protein